MGQYQFEEEFKGKIKIVALKEDMIMSRRAAEYSDIITQKGVPLLYAGGNVNLKYEQSIDDLCFVTAVAF